jgi:hypothetical protein
MKHLEIAEELKKNKEVFKALLKGIAPVQYIWRPQPEKWCLLEILCHLYDEEREDFRARVKQVLLDPLLPLSPIDPQGWVTERFYIGQDYEKMLENFLSERDESVTYLRSLDDPKWDNTYDHPKLGLMPASMFLHNWLAHDLLHIRQITAVKYKYLEAHVSDSLSYAGEW